MKTLNFITSTSPEYKRYTTEKTSKKHNLTS